MTKNALRLISTGLRSVQAPSLVSTLSIMGNLKYRERSMHEIALINTADIPKNLSHPRMGDTCEPFINIPPLAINGIGRIGKRVLQLALHQNFNVVAINQPDLRTEELVNFIWFDEPFRRYPRSVNMIDEDSIFFGDNTIRIFKEKDAEKIKWDEVPVDYVIDTTGEFTEVAEAKKHMAGGVKKVIISDLSEDAPMFIRGVNLDKYRKDMNVVSSASCATNCAANLLQTIDKQFGVEHCSLTTVHAEESSRRILRKFQATPGAAFYHLLDIPYSERSTMDAAQALGIVIPSLEGKVTSYTIRVPAKDVSLLKLCVRVKYPVKLSELKSPELWESDVVSCTEDQRGNYNYVFRDDSAIVDFNQVSVINEKFIMIGAWYDIERAHANRLLNLYTHMVKMDREKAAFIKV